MSNLYLVEKFLGAIAPVFSELFEFETKNIITINGPV